MRVLLLSDDMLAAGVPRYIGDLANGLTARDIRVTVAATDGPYRDRLGKGIDFVPLTMCRPGSTKRSINGIVKSCWTLNAFTQRERFDIIHTQKRFADAVGRALARRTGAVHVSTCHNTFLNAKALTFFGDYTIAVSGSMARLLTSHFGKPAKRLEIIYLGCRPLRVFSGNEIQSARARLGIPSSVKVIGSIGHLSKAKDRFTLLQALHLLKAGGGLDSTVCLIVGTGEEEQSVRRFVERSDLGSVVRLFTDVVDATEICNIADFFVLSSIQEGLPYVLLEAASLGKPHIATDVGGIGEFIQDQHNGLLVPPKHPAELATAIGRLLGNEGEVARLGANAKRQFEQNHSYDEFVDKTIAFYKLALAKKE